MLLLKLLLEHWNVFRYTVKTLEIPSYRYYDCPHHDYADGERPLFPASSFGHQGLGCLLLDLLRVCVRGPHRVCLCSLQRRLSTQRKGQSEGKQAELWGEENILGVSFPKQGTKQRLRGGSSIMNPDPGFIKTCSYILTFWPTLQWRIVLGPIVEDSCNTWFPLLHLWNYLCYYRFAKSC